MCGYKKNYIKIDRDFKSSLVLLLTVVGSQVVQGAESNDYIKASLDATMPYQLRSNLDRTHFLVDGKDVGTGRRLMIKLNNQNHTIIARPDNCEIDKEEFIQPPYNSEVPLSFTFLTGECERPVIVADNDAAPTINISGGNVNFSVGGQNNTTVSDYSSSSSTTLKHISPPQEKSKSGNNAPNGIRKSTLSEIGEFIQNVCKSTQTSGHSESKGISLSGEAEIGLKKLLNILPGIEVGGHGQYQKEEYVGVAQKDLLGLLNKDAECRDEIIRMLRDGKL